MTIELLEQDLVSKNKGKLGLLPRAIHGATDGSLIWTLEVRKREKPVSVAVTSTIASVWVIAQSWKSCWIRRRKSTTWRAPCPEGVRKYSISIG